MVADKDLAGLRHPFHTGAGFDIPSAPDRIPLGDCQQSDGDDQNISPIGAHGERSVHRAFLFVKV